MKRALVWIVGLVAGWTGAFAAPPLPAFFARRDYPDAGGKQVAVADTNGDGIPDLIALAGGYGLVQVLLGKGNSYFRQGPTSQHGMGASQFALADLNGDHHIDLILSGENSDESGCGIGVAFGNGDGTFQPAVYYPAGSDKTAFYLAIGDFNGDGIIDAVTVGSSGIWLYKGKGGGVFNPGLLIPFNGAWGQNMVAAADLRRNGKLDLIVSSIAGGFSVLLGNGDGTFQAQQDYPNPQAPGVPCSFVVGALVPGGYPDVAAGCESAAQEPIYLGNGTGKFLGPIYVDMPLEAIRAIVDVDGDGIPDLVNNYGYVAYGEGNRKFKPPVLYPIEEAVPFGGGPIIAAHLRSPNLVDLVAQGTGGVVSVLLNRGNRHFEDGVWTPLPSTSPCGAAADFNGDGKPDLALSTALGTSILLGTGSTSSPFLAGTPIALSNESGCLAAGDFNGDGIPDLLMPSYNPSRPTTGAMNVFLGKGDGTFTRKGGTPLPALGFIAVADFNRDGKLDFATSGNLFALGNGDGTFRTPASLVGNPPITGFNNLAAGDVNNDGWPDVVLTSGEEEFALITVLLNNHHGGFTESTIPTCQQPFSTPCNPSEVLLTDLNGDGNLDLVVGQVINGGIVVYLGDGKGGFTQQQAFQDVLQTPGPIMAGDVNGDGIPDIGLMEGGTLGIFLGKGDGTFYPAFYIGAGPDPGNIMLMNLHGQSPAAGLPDLVAPDSTGGVTVLSNTTK